jgi:hypothetical protein
MPLWLILIAIGVILLILGVAGVVAKILIWIGVIILAIGVIGTLMGRRGSRV